MLLSGDHLIIEGHVIPSKLEDMVHSHLIASNELKFRIKALLKCRGGEGVKFDEDVSLFEDENFKRLKK